MCVAQRIRALIEGPTSASWTHTHAAGMFKRWVNVNLHRTVTQSPLVSRVSIKCEMRNSSKTPVNGRESRKKKMQIFVARPTGLERSHKKMAVRMRGTKQWPPKKMRFCFARLANCSFLLLFFIENGNAVLLVVDEIKKDLCFLTTPRSYCLHACKNNPKFGLALQLWG